MKKFPRKPVPFYWASARRVHPLVAEGIWSIATEDRPAYQIWLSPTKEEKEQVAGAIHQFRAEDAKQGYCWYPGDELIKPKACSYVEPKEEKKDAEPRTVSVRARGTKGKRKKAAAAPGTRAPARGT